ncbi:hypothetical protein D3C85_1878220 [compost metagenome]
MRMLRRLARAQHRCKTHISTLEQRTPVVTGLAREQLGEQCPLLRPATDVPLPGELRVILQAQFLQQYGIKLRFQ